MCVCVSIYIHTLQTFVGEFITYKHVAREEEPWER